MKYINEHILWRSYLSFHPSAYFISVTIGQFPVTFGNQGVFTKNLLSEFNFGAYLLVVFLLYMKDNMCTLFENTFQPILHNVTVILAMTELDLDINSLYYLSENAEILSNCISFALDFEMSCVMDLYFLV
jgi:hypothetical protein